MHGFIKQSTASQSKMVGPFVDDTDFKTLETGLSINNTDVWLFKNGATGVNKNSGGGTHRNDGMYSLTFDATDSDTVGELTGSISVAGALVVVFKFTVLEEAVYDAMFAAAAPGYLQPTTAGNTLDVTATGAAGIDWGNVENKTTANVLSGTDIGDVATVTTRPSPGNWDDLAITLTNGFVTANLTSAAEAEITTRCNTSIVTYNLDHLMQTAVTGANVANNSVIAKLVSSSATADWDDFDNTSESLEAIAAASAPSAAAIADAVWDEPMAGHVTADTSGLVLNEWQDGGRLDLILDSRMAEASINTTGGAVDSVTLVATTTTNTDMVSEPPSTTAIADAVWDETLAGHVTADTAGLLLNDWQDGGRLDLILDARMAESSINTTGGAVDTVTTLTSLPAITSNWLTAAGLATDAVAEIVDGVWDEDVDTSHQTAGTAGKKLDDAGAAADPWSTALPGAYGAGTAGFIIGTNLDAVLTARTLATADYFDPAADTVANVTLVATTTTNTDMVAAAPTTTAIADAVWDETLAGHVTADTAGLLLNEWQDGGRLDLILDARMAETSISTTGGAVDTVTTLTNLPAITSNWLTSAGLATDAVAEIVDGVWDEDVDTSHQTAGTAGKKLDDAGGAADPWATTLPGAYGAGTAGFIVGTNLDAILTARTLPTASYFDPTTDPVANVTLVATTTTNTDMVAAAPTTTAIADAVWDETLAGHVTADTAGLLLNDWQDGGRLDLILDSRMAEASIDTTGGAIDNVTLVATTTTNTDMVAAAPTTVAIADAVWDELLAGHVTADSAGLVLNDWQDGGRLDLLIDAIPTTAMRGTDNAALASVCTEGRLAELDAANIPTDIDSLISSIVTASGEPGQGAPAVSASMQTKINWLYKAFRNKSTQTSTEYKLYDDSGATVDSKATVSDDATTFTREEIVTGP